MDEQLKINQLSIQEIQYLLSLLKETTIRGEQVEFFYNLVIKLQNQIILISKEN